MGRVEWVGGWSGGRLVSGRGGGWPHNARIAAPPPPPSTHTRMAPSRARLGLELQLLPGLLPLHAGHHARVGPPPEHVGLQPHQHPQHHICQRAPVHSGWWVGWVGLMVVGCTRKQLSSVLPRNGEGGCRRGARSHPPAHPTTHPPINPRACAPWTAASRQGGLDTSPAGGPRCRPAQRQQQGGEGEGCAWEGAGGQEGGWDEGAGRLARVGACEQARARSPACRTWPLPLWGGAGSSAPSGA